MHSFPWPILNNPYRFSTLLFLHDHLCAYKPTWEVYSLPPAVQHTPSVRSYLRVKHWLAPGDLFSAEMRRISVDDMLAVLASRTIFSKSSWTCWMFSLAWRVYYWAPLFWIELLSKCKHYDKVAKETKIWGQHYRHTNTWLLITSRVPLKLKIIT